ncbi:MAG TPA: ABC transporter permease [Steroidobacteraceae bacterium]|jgi:putative ABC transport system permease protein
MSALTQIAAVSAMNLRSIPQRLGTSSVVVIGIAGVVAVLISVLAMSTGFMKTLQMTGPENRAVVVRQGSSTELVSVLANEAGLAIADSAGVKKGSDGRPLASPETLLIVNLKKKDGEDASAPFRGFTPDGFAVHPEIKIISGRVYKAGVTELMVGKSAQRLYRGLDIGSEIKLRNATWTVVGTFESGGSGRESELLADKQTLNSAYQRGNGEQSVWVIIDPQLGFQAFKDAITTNPQLQVDVSTEKDFGTRQSAQISSILKIVAYVVGGIMAIGAIFGALNTMYSAVSTRSREIATLRAIGFGPVPVVVSVFVEALLLALIGGSIGALIAWLMFNGHSVDTLGGGFGGQLIFDLAVTPGLVGLGIVWACVIGVIGGLFPAVRAARLPVATALRAV